MAAISSLGVGSGLDLSSLVSGLLEAERAPTANRLAQKENDLTAELSAFGLLRSSLGAFQTTVADLRTSTAFAAKSVTLSNDSVFSASADNDAATGIYTVEVTALARAQSLATNAATAFATVDDVIGDGTLTLEFGTTTTGPYNFTPDPTRSPQAIEVSAANGNNTLSGFRDFINNGDYGVQASIIEVNDGSDYRLVLTSEQTGANNSLRLTVSGDGDGNDTDNAGLSQLAFNASAQSSLAQTVAAQDAALTINGLAISRDSNTVTGAIEGVTLDLLKTDPGNPVTLQVEQDRSGITASINAFVDAYNELQNNIDSLTAYNPETQSGSVLIGDFTVRSIESQIRGVIFSSISGLSGNIRSLVDIGITTDSSGKLDIDDARLKDALDNYAGEVEALFTLQGRTTDPGVRYVSATAETLPGTYAIDFTSFLTQGVYTGTGPITDLRVRNNNNELTLLVDGISTGNITLTNGTYVDENALAAEIQTQINAAAPLVTAGVSVTVTHDTPSNRFVITSDSEGSGSSVEVTAIDPQTDNDFGIGIGAGVAGTDFAATINGAATSAAGQVLTSLAGDSKGIAVEIVSGGTGARGTVTLTRGLAGLLDDLLDGILDGDGFIAAREDGISESLDGIEDDRLRLEDRLAQLEARLIRQFSALDALVAQFNQTSNFLTQQLAKLPQPGISTDNR